MEAYLAAKHRLLSISKGITTLAAAPQISNLLIQTALRLIAMLKMAITLGSTYQAPVRIPAMDMIGYRYNL
ncbi:MAG: hypothetical protein H7Y13_07115 [Sphingobacteriaceae bacterium]|nr:hypothetical protein [Sphingobacteriaceae bacterium]